MSVDTNEEYPELDFHLASDEFFEFNDEKFDLIFVDGYHEERQMVRDVEHALACLNPGGAIVCHDISPQTEDYQRTPQYGNGTCWKGWMRLRARGDLAMVAVDSDHGCGIIMRGSQKSLVVAEEDLCWSNLEANRERWLNLVPAEQYFEHLTPIAPPKKPEPLAEEKLYKSREPLDIIFRSCSRSGQKRYIDVPKSELLIGCLNSLLQSTKLAGQEYPQYVLTVHILDDHSDPAAVAAMCEMLEKSGVPYQFVPMEETGQAASMRFANEYARELKGDTFYFCEDDYLHAPTAISEMLEARELFSRNLGGRDVIISPCDHNVEYRAGLVTPTRVVLGTRRHWRVARGTTSTYLISRNMLLTYWDLYLKHATYDPNHGDICEDNTINLIYQTEFCFSPLPSLAAHVSNLDLQPLYAPWEAWWEQYKPEVKSPPRQTL
jgi:hypothetical protein